MNHNLQAITSSGFWWDLLQSAPRSGLEYFGARLHLRLPQRSSKQETVIFITPGSTCIHIPRTPKNATQEAQSILLEEASVRLPPAFKTWTPLAKDKSNLLFINILCYSGQGLSTELAQKMQPYWFIDKRSWDPWDTLIYQEGCTKMALWALKLGVMVHTCNPRSTLRRLRSDPISKIPKQENNGGFEARLTEVLKTTLGKWSNQKTQIFLSLSFLCYKNRN